MPVIKSKTSAMQLLAMQQQIHSEQAQSYRIIKCLLEQMSEGKQFNSTPTDTLLAVKREIARTDSKVSILYHKNDVKSN